MEEKEAFDFWYAVNNTEILLMPSRQLETFGTTVVNYHLISELMDNANHVRVREGRMHASRPTIVTPEVYSKVVLDGFGKEAEEYVGWLKEHERDLRVLQYGYALRQEAFSEYMLSGNMKAVSEQVRDAVRKGGNPMSAVVTGVDKPWDVCLIKLFWETAQRSVGKNVMDMEQLGLFEHAYGSPRGFREEIELDFLAASRNSALMGGLARKLHKHGLFEQYQDRFFAMVKAHKRR